MHTCKVISDSLVQQLLQLYQFLQLSKLVDTLIYAYILELYHPYSRYSPSCLQNVSCIHCILHHHSCRATHTNAHHGESCVHHYCAIVAIHSTYTIVTPCNELNCIVYSYEPNYWCILSVIKLKLSQIRNY